MTGCILTGYPTVKGEEIEVAESAVSSIDLSTRVLVAEPEPDLQTNLQQIFNRYTIFGYILWVSKR